MVNQIFIRTDKHEVEKEQLDNVCKMKINNIEEYFFYYNETDIHKDDLAVIKKHNSSYAIHKTLGKVEYYSFTHYHSLERLRKKKLLNLKWQNLENEDDGTIFGSVSKIIKVAEQVIKAHKIKISVDWNCWNDSYEFNEEVKK